MLSPMANVRRAPLRVVFRTLLSYWPRRRLQCALCLLGITLGVAVVTAMDLANASALTSVGTRKIGLS